MNFGEAEPNQPENLVLKPQKSLPYLRKRLGFLKHLFNLFYYHTFILHRYRQHYLHFIRTAEYLLKRIDAQLVLLPEGNVQSSLDAWVQAAHQLQISAIIIPYNYSNAVEPAEAFYYDRAYDARRPKNRLVAYFYPQWVYTYKGKPMVRLPAYQILAIESLKLAPPLPWVQNSTNADAIAVDSETIRENYLRDGIPAEKLILTGAIYNDTLSAISQDKVRYRTQLYEELGLPVAKPMLLCSLPPDQMNTNRPCDFQAYADLVEFWVKTLLTVTNYNLVINLHPRINYESICYIEDWGARIARQDTASLIPMADIYIASISSVIRLAIACGIPVINYDVYRYGYTDYDSAPGVITLEEKDEFIQWVQALTQQPDTYQALARQQQTVMQRWGNLDGKTSQRMLALFDRLTNS